MGIDGGADALHPGGGGGGMEAILTSRLEGLRPSFERQENEKTRAI
jgi:hypothetical protein